MTELNQKDIVSLLMAGLQDWYDLKPKPVFVPGETLIRTAQSLGLA